MLLEVGSSVSKFSSYEHFQIDSLLRVSTLSVSSIALKVLSRKHLSPEFFESVFFNYPANRVTLTGRIVATDFVYDEPLPVFEWKITEETDSWCGYLIQKALCRFRGRDYEAWFAPDIPVPLGPWKFWGLPGLIIKIHDFNYLGKYYYHDDNLLHNLFLLYPLLFLHLYLYQTHYSNNL